MNRRRLLLFTYYFPPCGAVAVHRMLAFTRYLPEFGWDVVVVAPPSVDGEPVDAELLNKVRPDTEIVSVPFPQTLWSRIAARFFRMETWLPGAWSSGQAAIARYKPDAILSSSPPGCVHKLGYKAKMKFGLPWVACFRDPWVTNLLDYRRSWLMKLSDLRGERLTMRHADLILANTPLGLQGFQKAYPEQSERMICIPNGFDPQDDNVAAPVPQVKSTIKLLHAGELYCDRDPRPLLDAVRTLLDHSNSGMPSLRVDFLGRVTVGNLDLALEIHKRRLEDQVTWRNHAPYQDAVRAMKEADILVVFHSPRYQLGVPAKVYEYIGIGKPILALAEPGGDIDRVLASTGVTYRLVSPLDPAKVRSAIEELALEIARGTARPPDPDKARAYTRRELMRSLAHRLDSLVSPTPANVGGEA